MFGTVPGFNKTLFHASCQNPKDFAASIVDIYELTKPELNIIDAVIGMEGRGPSEGKPRTLGVLIASTDAVAADTVGSYLIGYEPMEINTTAIASERGLGEARLNKIEIVGAAIETVRQKDWQHARNMNQKIQALPPWLFRFLASRISIKPVIDQKKCTRCQVCVKNCPAKTIYFYPDKNKVEIDHKRCIYCFCCHELCPFKAIELHKSRLAKLMGL
jgi:Pyruvate/2-oxoacid:ferredoxin oxidoreductase delta subunit